VIVISSQPIMVLVNPRAGRGRAMEASSTLADSLRSARYNVIIRLLEQHMNMAQLGQELTGAACTVIVGGDGTLHYVLPALVAAQTPVFHLALGTENLFARGTGAFGPDAAQRLIKGLKHGKTHSFDIGEVCVQCGPLARDCFELGVMGEPACAPELFALMVSTGPDASVVSRLSGARRGAISHFSYVGHIAREAMSPYFPYIDVKAWAGDCNDTQVSFEQRKFRGIAVIANSPEYALRINPAHNANTRDGLLTLALLSATHPLAMVRSLVGARDRRESDRSPPCGNYTKIMLHLYGPKYQTHHLQSDGDPIRLPLSPHGITVYARVASSMCVLDVHSAPDEP
jgi:diacylglycerol kinase family enzyme